MLCELQISNFGLIESQSISFGSGLNVVTGETGAGKSLLLQAIQFLLGSKMKNQIVRSGAEEAEVQGLFNLEKISPDILEELPDIAKTEELSISRSISLTGKGKVFVNGRLASLAVLEDIAEKLVNICGQNQHVRLLNPKYHLQLVDNFSGLERELARYAEAYALWRKQSAAVTELKERGASAERRRFELEGIVEELASLKLREGMRAELEAEVKRLGGAERLIAAGQGILDVLNGEGGLLSRFQAVQSGLQEMQKLDPALSATAAMFSGSRSQAREFEAELSKYVSKVNVDEKSLESLRDELAEVARLERKYHRDEAGLIELLSSSKAELEQLEQGGNLRKLEEDLAVSEKKLRELAEDLSRNRKQGGEKLAKAAVQELEELALGGSRLALNLSSGDFGLNGFDHGELLISTNKGEPMKPLREIASGGELARIMLVLKKVLRDRTGVNVLVFDEVDAGVSGGVARAVGRKLKELAQYSQVLCVTHLPQVASLADQHFLVGKTVKDRATTVISSITAEKRVEEIARMLSGHTITPAARESAKELLSSEL